MRGTFAGGDRPRSALLSPGKIISQGTRSAGLLSRSPGRDWQGWQNCWRPELSELSLRSFFFAFLGLDGEVSLLPMLRLSDGWPSPSERGSADGLLTTGLVSSSSRCSSLFTPHVAQNFAVSSPWGFKRYGSRHWWQWVLSLFSLGVGPPGGVPPRCWGSILVWRAR